MKKVIQLENMRKSYGSIVAVDGISFDVVEGEIFGIVGPNGAGKTTTIEIIEGLRRADSGIVKVLGKDIGIYPQEIKQRIGVLLQSTSIPEKAKIKEIFKLFSSFYDKSMDLPQMSQFLGLEDKQNETFKSLSGGWKQRVSLALALINDPEIVFLDEPSMGLDPNARSEMWNMIMRLRDEGRTIVVTTHYMEEAETLCDRVAVIDRGQLIALDTPKKLITQLGSGRRIGFNHVERANKESIASIPHVTHIEWKSDQIKLHTSNLDQTLKHLFHLAHNENWVVSDLKLEDASMNDVFNELTQLERKDKS